MEWKTEENWRPLPWPEEDARVEFSPGAGDVCMNEGYGWIGNGNGLRTVAHVVKTRYKGEGDKN